jgi:biotin carboxylase
MHVLLIGAFKSVIDASKKVGIRLTVLEQPGNLAANMNAVVERMILADYSQDQVLIPVLKSIHANDPIDMVLSFDDAWLLLAVELSEILEITPSVPRLAVERSKNKLLMRQVLETAGLALPHAKVSSTDDIFRFMKATGGPIVVKPLDGEGALDVVKLNTVEDITPTFGNELNGSWIAESFLEGEEMSVETFSFDGNHVMLFFADKDKIGDGGPNPFVAVGASGPAFLSEETKQSISAVVSRCLDAVGYRDGPSHTEFILTSTGPQIVETHTRVAGGRIAQLLKMSTGIDVFELALRWMCMRQGSLTETPHADSGAAIQFFFAKPGRIISIVGTETAKAMDGVVDVKIYKSVGDNVSELRELDDLIGYVICVAPNAQDARALSRHVRDNVVTIETEM